MEVKLTVKLPEDLRRQARAVAALRGETVSEVVREALAEYVTQTLEDAEDTRLAREIKARIAEGREATYTHEQIWGEIDALESAGELPS